MSENIIDILYSQLDDNCCDYIVSVNVKNHKLVHIDGPHGVYAHVSLTLGSSYWVHSLINMSEPHNATGFYDSLTSWFWYYLITYPATNVPSQLKTLHNMVNTWTLISPGAPFADRDHQSCISNHTHHFCGLEMHIHVLTLTYTVHFM